MKAFVKTAIMTGVPFGIAMGFYFGLKMGVAFGLPMGIASGVAFGLAMAGFMAVQRRRFAKARPEFTGEHLLHDGPANHFLNGEGVGGWLFLTRERLLFRSHEFNIQRHELSVPIAEITQVQAVRTAKVIPNGLRVVTRSGEVERFVVEAHRKWCDEILRAQTPVAPASGYAHPTAA